MTDKPTIRKAMRKLRQAFTIDEQTGASMEVFKRMREIQLLASANHIAVYLANDGEIDPNVIVTSMWRSGKKTYLPILREGNELGFLPYEENTALKPNRVGIPEPVTDSDLLTLDKLDAVLLPLVAFDKQKNRLGMGGGFYDRSLAECLTKACPLLIGLGHECQLFDGELPCDPWDVPLDIVVTDKTIYR